MSLIKNITEIIIERQQDPKITRAIKTKALSMYLQRRMINNTKIPMGAFHSAHNEKTFRDRGSGFVWYVAWYVF